MTRPSELPWRRYRVITELAAKSEEQGSQFGKTALQKMVYLLFSLFETDFGCRFRLHTYGPFCADLLQDLSFCESIGAVRVQDAPSGLGYEISPGEAADFVRQRGELSDEFQGAIDQLLTQFQGKTARELELFATTVYVYREHQEEGPVQTDRLLRTVRDLKPKFTETDIAGVVKELQENAHLTDIA